MLRIEKDIVSFQLAKRVNRLTWITLSLVEELYNDGSNFSHEELERIRKVVREEAENAKSGLDDFLIDLERTEIKLKN